MFLRVLLFLKEFEVIDLSEHDIVVINQNESEVGSDMLLVSDALFHKFIQMYAMSMLKPGTCRKYIIAVK